MERKFMQSNFFAVLVRAVAKIYMKGFLEGRHCKGEPPSMKETEERIIKELRGL